MKLHPGRKLRLALIIVFTIFLVAASFFLIKALTGPGLVEETVPQFSYSQQARVDYRVYLKPNSLYPEKSLAAGKVYLTNFVDYINTFFTYKFSGDQVAEVKGEYEVVAVVEATAGKDNKKVWQREFTLLPKTGFAGRDRVVSAQQVLPLQLHEYNNFAVKVIKDSELVPDEVKMTVRWNVTVEAATDSGTVREQIAPVMVIPLVQKAFQVGGEPVREKSGAITAVRQVPAEVNRKAVTLYGVLAGLCAAALALLLFFTSGKTAEDDPLQQKVNQIFKRHGDRLAVIDGEATDVLENVIPVKSIDDLVRIADELSRPIIYRPFSGQGDLPSFYVFDGQKIFVCELKESRAWAGRNRPDAKP